MKKSADVRKLLALRVIPVLRLGSRRDTETAIDCLIEAGFRTVELTLTTPDAIELIGSLRRSSNADFLVGAGTVLDLGSAQDCLDAGADYLVSPCLVPGMAALANDAGRLALTGAFTPAEVLAAWREGAAVVKISRSLSRGLSRYSLVSDRRRVVFEYARLFQGRSVGSRHRQQRHRSEGTGGG